MSNPFTSFRYLPGAIGGSVLTWSIDPTFTDPLPHNFTLQLSGTPDFSEVLTEIPGGDVACIVDTTNIQQDNLYSIYYRVKLVTGNDEHTYYSRILTTAGDDYTRRQYVLAREIARKEILRMKYTGFKATLLKRKIYGIPATDAGIDPVSGVPLTDQADNLGNNTVVGYYAPIPFIISFEDTPVEHRGMSRDGLGVTEIIQQNFRAAGFPIIETDDIIVLTTNRDHYVVKSKETSCFPGTDLVIVQTCTAQLSAPTDPINNIHD